MPQTASSFDTWMAAVNAAIQRLAYLDADDLPDFDYRSAYEDDATPAQAARAAIANAEDEEDYDE